jgi:hypothetical protein
MIFIYYWVYILYFITYQFFKKSLFIKFKRQQNKLTANNIKFSTL